MHRVLHVRAIRTCLVLRSKASITLPTVLYLNSLPYNIIMIVEMHKCTLQKKLSRTYELFFLRMCPGSRH